MGNFYVMTKKCVVKRNELIFTDPECLTYLRGQMKIIELKFETKSKLFYSILKRSKKKHVCKHTTSFVTFVKGIF